MTMGDTMNSGFRLQFGKTILLINLYDMGTEEFQSEISDEYFGKE